MIERVTGVVLEEAGADAQGRKMFRLVRYDGLIIGPPGAESIARPECVVERLHDPREDEVPDA